MSRAKRPQEPADLQNLSDKVLIKRFCPDRKDEEAVEELWRRHSETVYEALQKCSRYLCPAFYDWQDLAHASFLQARNNFLNRICGFRELESARSFKSWLIRLAWSTTRDVRRPITQSRVKKKIREVSLETAFGDRKLGRQSSDDSPTEPLEEEFPVDAAEQAYAGEGAFSRKEKRKRKQEVLDKPDVDTDEVRSHHLWYRSQYSPRPIDPAAPVERKIVEQQRKFIVRYVLVQYAAESDENTDSARLLRERYFRKYPVRQLIVRRFGEPSSKRERETRERAIYRWLDHDYDEVLALMGRMFGITAPEHI